VRRISDLSEKKTKKNLLHQDLMQEDKDCGTVLATPVAAQISTTQTVDSPPMNTVRNPTKIVLITTLNSTYSRCVNASG
jgi:hypothetical protein